MSVSNFVELLAHVGHKVVVVTYGRPAINVAIECEDCNEVLLDYNYQNLKQCCCCNKLFDATSMEDEGYCPYCLEHCTCL